MTESEVFVSYALNFKGVTLLLAWSLEKDLIPFQQNLYKDLQYTFTNIS